MVAEPAMPEITGASLPTETVKVSAAPARSSESVGVTDTVLAPVVDQVQAKVPEPSADLVPPEPQEVAKVWVSVPGSVTV